MSEPSGVNTQCSQERDSLLNLLFKFQASKVTDQRDMIFALIGISSDPSHHELLRPKYAISLSELVHNTVRYWLTSTAVTLNDLMLTLSFRIKSSISSPDDRTPDSFILTDSLETHQDRMSEATHDTETTITVNWMGGGEIKKRVYQLQHITVLTSKTDFGQPNKAGILPRFSRLQRNLLPRWLSVHNVLGNELRLLKLSSETNSSGLS